MDVLDCLVSLLPQLHLDSSVQLDQPCVQIPLLRLWAVEIDRVGSGVLLLDDQVQVVPQLVAELPELSLALILQTKPKYQVVYNLYINISLVWIPLHECY